MLIRELQKHFPARLPEWWNAAAMFAWGYYILTHVGALSNPAFAAFRDMASSHNPTLFWGCITLAVGTVRLAALFVNGVYSRTPVIRVVTSAASAFVWMQVVLGLLATGEPTPGVVMYGAAVALDLISAYRASCDAVIAIETKRSRRMGEKRGISGGYNSVGMA